MALKLGINCINLTDNSTYVNEVAALAKRLPLPFYHVGQPLEIKPVKYVIWITNTNLTELRIWLNRVDYSLSSYTRIAWIPCNGNANDLPAGLDFAIFDSKTTAIEQLITTQQKAFSPFFDHISGLAFKNTLGFWTLNLK
jgi:hypothetical protein